MADTLKVLIWGSAEEGPCATDLAWAAGFVDGEGCIQTTVRMRSRNRRDYILGLYVGQVDPRPLYRLSELFGGVVYPKSSGPTERRPMFMWRVTGSTAEATLRALLPFLLVKREQADLALQLRDRIADYVKVGRRVDDHETEARLALVAAVKADKWRDHREEVMPTNA